MLNLQLSLWIDIAWHDTPVQFSLIQNTCHMDTLPWITIHESETPGYVLQPKIIATAQHRVVRRQSLPWRPTAELTALHSLALRRQIPCNESLSFGDLSLRHKHTYTLTNSLTRTRTHKHTSTRALLRIHTLSYAHTLAHSRTRPGG